MLTATPPHYVQHGSRLMPPPPYVHRGAKVHSFAVGADLGLIQRMCDIWFTETSGGAIEYRVLSRWLFVVCVNIDSVSSQHPDHRDSGYMSEIDIGIWALVLRTKPFSLWPRWLPIQLFVDSAPAAFVGREVYGFPKQVGRFSVPGNAPANDPFSIEGFVVPTPNAAATWKEVIGIRPIPNTADDKAATWSSVEEAYDALTERFVEKDASVLSDVFPTAKHLRQAFVVWSIPMAFLKQFLDAHESTAAAYQGVVEAEAGILAFRRGGFTPSRFELNVSSYYTLPFEQTLGLRSGWQDVGRGMWSDFDFVMRDGNVLWRSGT
jgi:hypothetical protein